MLYKADMEIQMIRKIGRGVKRFLKRIMVKSKGVLMNTLRVFPINHNRVVFMSDSGLNYNDNPKAVSDALLGISDKSEIIWIYNGSIDNDRIRVVKYGSIKSMYYLATAKVWVDNSRKELWMRKRKKQVYIQTWHGCIGNKYIEYDAEELLPDSYMEVAMHDGPMIDIMISDGRFCTDLYRRAFRFNKEIVEAGSPRLDKFVKYKESDKHEIRQKLEIDDDTFVILYAPTFRMYTLSPDIYKLDFDRIAEQSGKTKYKILYRMHPNALSLCSELDYGENAIDVSRYPDIYELICACDLIISDYSSCAFEAGLIEKPSFLYVPDEKEYIEKERKLYFDMETLPYPYAYTENMLIDRIKDFDYADYKKQLKCFYDKIGVKEEGSASETVANIIINKLEGE